LINFSNIAQLPIIAAEQPEGFEKVPNFWKKWPKQLPSQKCQNIYINAQFKKCPMFGKSGQNSWQANKMPKYLHQCSI
jgi:hypothetical protein